MYVHNDRGGRGKVLCGQGGGFQILLKLCGCPLAGNGVGGSGAHDEGKRREGSKGLGLAMEELGWAVLGKEEQTEVAQVGSSGKPFNKPCP